MADRAAADGSGVRSEGVTHPVLTALGRGIPLTLLLDLAEPSGPDSRAIIATETADLEWLAGLVFAASPSRSSGAHVG